ncbi:hypothetical protein [Chelativorans sp. Marseille-P2723]|uniref:hypothetical protein n=1 Tax=Chelativorans sp. Marseille-P2723 TaxID=2709133 RepID=UPI00156F1B31|nr:hypothetical protein [Chelativorans sp. Marseille-P2723]
MDENEQLICELTGILNGAREALPELLRSIAVVLEPPSWPQAEMNFIYRFLAEEAGLPARCPQPPAGGPAGGPASAGAGLRGGMREPARPCGAGPKPKSWKRRIWGLRLAGPSRRSAGAKWPAWFSRARSWRRAPRRIPARDDGAGQEMHDGCPLVRAAPHLPKSRPSTPAP